MFSTGLMQSPLRNTPSRSWGVDERSRELGREHVRGLFFHSLKCRIEFVIQLVEITPKATRLGLNVQRIDFLFRRGSSHLRNQILHRYFCGALRIAGDARRCWLRGTFRRYLW